MIAIAPTAAIIPNEATIDFLHPPFSGVGLSGVVASVTTIAISAVFPFAVVTVIEQAPFLTAVTLPFASTVATSGLDEVYVTVLLVAFSGATVAVKVND